LANEQHALRLAALWHVFEFAETIVSGHHFLFRQRFSFVKEKGCEATFKKG
jgi:hypothetical protein